MNEIILNSIIKQYAIDCDNNPNKELLEIWEDCKKELISNGIPKDILSKIDFEKQIKPCFSHKLLPNPDYWKKKLGQNITFFMIEARSKNYEYLLSLFEEHVPDLTYFVCYGKKDVIIRFLGNDEMIEELEDILFNKGFNPSIIRTSDVIVFYDKELPLNKDYLTPDLDQKEIDRLLTANFDDLEKNIVQNLEKIGLVLNSVIYEDTHYTSRIRSIIGIKTNHILSRIEIKKIETELHEIDEEEFTRRHSRPISSIYKCNNTYFAYIIEGIFDDQEQLDYVTDLIQKIELIGDTETIILAKAKFKPFSFSRRLVHQLDNAIIVDPLAQEKLLPLSNSFAEYFPRINQKYLYSSTTKQFVVLSIFNELILKNTTLKINDYPLVIESIENFFDGILEGKTSMIRNAGQGYFQDVVEKRHLKFVQSIITNVLKNDLGNVQTIFGAPNTSWQKWGLYPWGEEVLS